MDLEKAASMLSSEIAQAIDRLHIADLEAELQKLQLASQAADFWQDNLAAQEVMKQISRLEGRIAPWRELELMVRDIRDLIALNDSSLATDLQKQLAMAEQSFLTLKNELKFIGPYDDHDVIMSIFAGAGGTDAQDWAQMLLRM
jgi:peptide chain release factor 2